MHLVGNTYTLLFQIIQRCIGMMPNTCNLNLIQSKEITRKMQNTKTVMIKPESALTFYQALPTAASSF